MELRNSVFSAMDFTYKRTWLFPVTTGLLG